MKLGHGSSDGWVPHLRTYYFYPAWVNRDHPKAHWSAALTLFEARVSQSAREYRAVLSSIRSFGILDLCPLRRDWVSAQSLGI